MNVSINGSTKNIPDQTTIETLLGQLGLTDSFVAVALNNECISRHDFAQTTVQENDKVEILAPMAGG